MAVRQDYRDKINEALSRMKRAGYSMDEIRETAEELMVKYDPSHDSNLIITEKGTQEDPNFYNKFETKTETKPKRFLIKAIQSEMESESPDQAVLFNLQSQLASQMGDEELSKSLSERAIRSARGEAIKDDPTLQTMGTYFPRLAKTAKRRLIERGEATPEGITEELVDPLKGAMDIVSYPGRTIAGTSSAVLTDEPLRDAISRTGGRVGDREPKSFAGKALEFGGDILRSPVTPVSFIPGAQAATLPQKALIGSRAGFGEGLLEGVDQALQGKADKADIAVSSILGATGGVLGGVVGESVKKALGAPGVKTLVEKANEDAIPWVKKFINREGNQDLYDLHAEGSIAKFMGDPRGNDLLETISTVNDLQEGAHDGFVNVIRKLGDTGKSKSKEAKQALKDMLNTPQLRSIRDNIEEEFIQSGRTIPSNHPRYNLARYGKVSIEPILDKLDDKLMSPIGYVGSITRESFKEPQYKDIRKFNKAIFDIKEFIQGANGNEKTLSDIMSVRQDIDKMINFKKKEGQVQFNNMLDEIGKDTRDQLNRTISDGVNDLRRAGVPDNYTESLKDAASAFKIKDELTDISGYKPGVRLDERVRGRIDKFLRENYKKTPEGKPENYRVKREADIKRLIQPQEDLSGMARAFTPGEVTGDVYTPGDIGKMLEVSRIRTGGETFTSTPKDFTFDPLKMIGGIPTYVGRKALGHPTIRSTMSVARQLPNYDMLRGQLLGSLLGQDLTQPIQGLYE